MVDKMKLISDKTFKEFQRLKSLEDFYSETRHQIIRRLESEYLNKHLELEEKYGISRTVCVSDEVKTLTNIIDTQRDLITKLHKDIDVLQRIKRVKLKC